MIAKGSHVFVPDEISLLDDFHVDIAKLASAAQITDTYLLALASSQNATFVTFDKRMITSAVVSPNVSILTLL